MLYDDGFEGMLEVAVAVGVGHIDGLRRAIGASPALGGSVWRSLAKVGRLPLERNQLLLPGHWCGKTVKTGLNKH